jgi:DNA polymerase-3 subunit alpha
LKANHPREFMAALLTTEAGNHDKLARYIGHCRQLNVPVLPPCVNESYRDFTVVEEGVRFGLAGIKNVGEGAIESILDARSEEGGPYRDVFDFAARIDGRRVNRRVVESLVKCGAFDSLHPDRSSVWTGLDVALEVGAAEQRDREIGQVSLFGGGSGGAAPAPALPDAPPWAERQRLEYEKEVLGFYVTGHPLAAVLPHLTQFTDVTADAVEGRAGREVRAGGLLTSLRETRTRRGALMAFATLEDMTGSFDLVIFSEPFAQYGTLLRAALSDSSGTGPKPLIVTGNLEPGEPPKILVRSILDLDHAEEKLAAQIRVRITAEEATPDHLAALRDLLQRHSGECEVVLQIVIPDESETSISLPGLEVLPNETLRREVNGLFGRVVTEVEL